VEDNRDVSGYICEMLKIDPDYIRRILRQITQPEDFAAQDLSPVTLRLAS